MKISLPNKATAYQPEVIGYLESLLAAQFTNLQRKLHHPIDIFAIASQDVWENMDDLLDLLAEITEQRLWLNEKDQKWKKLLRRQLDHTLDALVQFLDSCRAIIACCYTEQDKNKSAKATRRFNDAHSDLTDRFKHVVNKIKHEQRVLQVMYFHGPDFFYPGYFVEGVVDAKTAGPDPGLHKNSHTAYSLNRDLRIFAAAIFLASSALAQELKTAFSTAAAVKPTGSNEYSNLILRVLKKISALPTVVFPDEMEMPCADIRVKLDDATSEASITLEYPGSRAKPMGLPHVSRIGLGWTVRRVANSLRPPYFKGDQ